MRGTSTRLLILFCNWLATYNSSFYTWLCSPQACSNNKNNNDDNKIQKWAYLLQSVKYHDTQCDSS